MHQIIPCYVSSINRALSIFQTWSQHSLANTMLYCVIGVLRDWSVACPSRVCLWAPLWAASGVPALPGNPHPLPARLLLLPLGTHIPPGVWQCGGVHEDADRQGLAGDAPHPFHPLERDMRGTGPAVLATVCLSTEWDLLLNWPCLANMILELNRIPCCYSRDRVLMRILQERWLIQTLYHQI